MGVSRTPHLLTILEAAEVLRIQPQTVWRKIRKGDIPATKPFGVWLIRVEDIDALLAQGVPAEPEPEPAENGGAA